MLQHSQQPTTGDWVRGKIRNNEPFLLDEPVPTLNGMPFYAALGWPVDDKSNGYRNAKGTVKRKVPVQDWGFADSQSYPQKSEGKIGLGWGGSNKKKVALTSNGVKHLLAHVPNQEMARAWLQHLIDSEAKLLEWSEAVSRRELADCHTESNGAVIQRFGVKAGSNAIYDTQHHLYGERNQSIKKRIKETNELKGKAGDINHHNYATQATRHIQRNVSSNLALKAALADSSADVKVLAVEAAEKTLDIVEDSNPSLIRYKNGHRCVEFGISSGPAMNPTRAKRIREDHKALRKKEKAAKKIEDQQIFLPGMVG